MALTGEAALWDAWRPLAEKALKGAPFDTLRTRIADGPTLEPIYPPRNPVYSGRPEAGPWQVVQRVDGGAGPARQAREDLENGATGLALVFAGAPGADGRGLLADTVDGLDEALAGILLDHCSVRLEAGARGLPALALLLALARSRGTPPMVLSGGVDPFGSLAAAGEGPAPETLAPLLAGMLRTADEAGLAGTLLTADARPLAEAGATPAHEVAFALAATAALARALDGEGIAPDVSLPAIEIALCADVDEFATIAKMRAARRLHGLLAAACGVDRPLTLHATTTARMLSFSDPQTNLLRLTIAAFAAGVGGADSVTVRAFDAAASPFARRMARNVQTLLLEESHVDMLCDPAAGAGAIEAYTDAIAEEAWRLFQAYEREGLTAAIASGTVADAVTAAAEASEAALADGEKVMIGVTRHPPPAPTPVPQIAPVEAPTRHVRPVEGDGFAALLAAAGAGASLADLAAALPASTITAPPLPPARAARPFEG
ncbi:methylmalonyl-CoA mutase family protein [Acuticoccus mangrovi]|uniref:Methylmalonyl-CoA mutase n=1 Tax=Acuticoccus mangrovi TaxID=2796142 RepID=A0A934ILI6_9HYPH|nr:methylmalonyl-CoA mutase family protein [Acuticoccus mangrovi]MBJ3774472.1 methylmalonyl-CoA mutase [Acuticoccus mangrovi]